MSKHKIIICGGGFGGVKAALKLTSDPRCEVTLISDIDEFRYYPTLFRTATGGKRMISSIPYSDIFARRKIKLIKDEVISVNRSDKTVDCEKNKGLNFDTLILSLGVKTNYFGIKGLKEYSYGIKTIEEAESLKSHLHEQICDEKKLDLNYVVIGGGPSGIELAGALPKYLKKISAYHGIKNKVNITLIEAAPRLLPRVPADVSRSVLMHLLRKGIRIRLGSTVQAETADALTVNGRDIKSHTVIWTAGVLNHPFFKKNNFQLTRTGKVRVDQYLMSESDIFVIGDNADTPYSGMAQTALYDGDFVAKNLVLKLSNLEMHPYIANKPISVFPAGERWAAVIWGRARIYGLPGWILRRAADLVAYKDYEPWHSASKRWLAEDDYEDDCKVCGFS